MRKYFIKRLLLISSMFVFSSTGFALTSTGDDPQFYMHSRTISNAFCAPTLGTYSATTVIAGQNASITPTAAPTNSTSTVAYSTTNFSGTLTVDLTTGVVRVTNANQAGTYLVTVQAFSSTGCTSTTTFTLTVSNSLCSEGNFSGSTNVSVGSGPYSVAIGDFNGDGKQDVAAANYTSSTVSIRLGNGAGGFSGTTNVSVGTNPYSVAIGDFNGDGKQDIAAANYTSSTVSIRLGDGTGGFGGSTEVSVGAAPFSVAIGDFNEDGKQDFATANYGSANVSIRLGNGTGGFSGSTNVSVGIGPRSLAIGDFNGDGKQDIAAANDLSNTVSIRLGDGAGGFSGSTNVSVGTRPFSVAIGDFNGDGKQDIASANPSSANVSIRLGNGAGVFSGSTNVSVGNSPYSVAIGDFNGDGKQDFATANDGTTVSVRIGDGTGGFSGSTNVSVESGPYSVAIGDFNGDGTQDIATANWFSGTVSIRLGVGSATFTTQPGATVCSNTDVTYTTQSGQTNYVWSLPGTLGTDYTITSGGVGSSSNTVTLKWLTAGSKTVTINYTFSNGCTPATATSSTATMVIGTPTLGTYSATTVIAGQNASITPTAAPTNSTSIVAYSTTNFIGTLTVNPTTGVVSVTNAKQAGTYLVTVKAFSSGCTSTATFTLTVSNPNCSQGNFSGTTNVGVGSRPSSVAIGDFNGDGKQDFAAANYNSANVSIRLGDGTGGFSGSTNVDVGTNPYSVAIGDFNGDGKQDIAVANSALSTVSIRLGDGIGGFSGSTEVSVGAAPLTVAIGDFNGDGKQDIAAANYGSTTVSIRLGDGTGGFSGSTNVGVGSAPVSVAIGDFNGDGKQDIAAANWSSANVSIRLGDGTGGFSGSTNVGVGTNPRSVAIGDFNGDGKQDIAAANWGSANVSILLGNGTGGFSGSTNVSVGSQPFSVAIGDFNGDGKQDIAVANSNSASLSIRIGDGAGGFSGSTNVGVGYSLYSVAIGDFNGDGNQDFATANHNSTSVSIGLGVSSAPSFTAQPGATACPNTDVTYTTQSGQTNYVWTIPGTLGTDYTITSGGIGTTSNTVTLKWLTVGSKTVTINYTSSSCSAGTAISSTATTVSTLPTPTFTAQPGETACPNTDVTYTTESGQTNYVWTVPGTLNTDYSITSGGVGTTSNTVTLKWLTVGTKTITIRYSSNGCAAATTTSSTATSVSTIPTPTFTAQPGATACASTDVTYTTQSGQTNYVWTVPGTENTDYTITSGGLGTSSNTVTLKWLSTGSKTVTINYTNSCNNSATTATSSTATTVSGSPTTANAGVDQTSASTCGLTSVTLSGNTPTVGTGAWSIVSGTGGTVTTPSSATSTFTGTAGSTYTLRWTISNSPCTASTDDVVITFNQPSVAGTISGAGSTCFGTNKILTLTGNTGTIQWQVSTTSISSGFSDISGATASTYTVPSNNAVGTYYYQAVVTNGVCSAATTVTAATVNVIAYPTVADITGNDDVCLSGSTTLSNATAGGVWSSTTPSIATINATSGLVTGVASGSVTLNYTVTNYAAGESAYGSVLLNGTNQSLSLNPGLGTIGTGAFTFECWFKLNSTPSNRSSILGTGTGNYLSINVNSLTEIETDAYGINRLGFAVPTMSVGTWYHLAVVRNSSGVETIFLNGVRSTTGAVTDSKNYNGPSKTIGHWQAGTYFPGNLASIRAVVGSALYDPSQSTITVPSFPLSAVTNTKLLLLAASSATFLTDGSGVQTVTNNNTSTWSSSAPASSIGCPTTVTKTVTVKPILTVTAASSSPIVNINTAITNVTHTTTGATGITNNGVSGANGLPPGISAAWSGNTITISGTPTVTGTFNYSIPLTTGCNVVSATGTIIVFSVWSWTGLGGNNLWSDGNNWSAGTIPVSGGSIEINSANVQMDLDFAVGRALTLSGSATLTVQAGKTLSIPAGGEANFGGKLVTFKSDATGTGQLGLVAGTLTGATNVTVERHIPASNRAFRFLGSAVTTTGSIRDNWMEGATPGVAGGYPYSTLSAYNPVPGYGTHITGVGGNSNGFDATTSGNPSMFTFNIATGDWQAVTSVTGTISAGSAYRLFIRGDRGINLSSTSTIPTGGSTILRTRGTVATGTLTSGVQLPALNQTVNGWSLVGNPYQSVVDMSSASVVKTNLTDYYYVWDPRMGTRGAYVAYNYVTNISTNLGSAVNRYLQPGQAFFVQSNAAGSVLQFTEVGKGAASNQTATFAKNGSKDGFSIELTQDRNELTQVGGFASLSIMLYDTDSLAMGGTPADATRVLFGAEYNNNVDQKDGKKFTNLDEMMSVKRNTTLLSMEQRSLPDTGTVLPLNITQYRVTKYTLRLYWDRMLTDSTHRAYLKDRVTGKEYAIERSGKFMDVPFVLTADAKSSAADRFEVVFKSAANVVTALTNWSNGDYIKVYPNPVISLMQVEYRLGMQRELTLKVYDMSGREVLERKQLKSGDRVNLSGLLRGIYQFQLLDKTGKLLMAGKVLKD